MARSGVLSDATLKDLMQQGGFIDGIEHGYVNPASVDLPLGEEAYRIERLFLPRADQTVRSMLHQVGATPHDMRLPLEVGVPYLVRIGANIELPQGTYGYANPKSSTGRVNLFARLVRDNVAMYDAIPAGTPAGETWVLLRAESFPILLPPTTPRLAVSQLRLFSGPGFLDPLELQNSMRNDGLFYHPDGRKYPTPEYHRHRDSIFLPVRLQPGAVGWECRGTNKVLDFSKVGGYKPEQFFTPVVAKGGSIELRKGSFYILTTDPCVRVPPQFSAELRITDHRLGNYRVHAAGFIDPGWGWGKDGEAHGRPITLEMVAYEDNVLLQNGQNVARIRYEWMREPPTKLYDEVPSNYTTQSAARLSKHFAQAA